MEQFFGIIISAIFGAIFGSYSTLFAHRLPIGESCFGRYFGKKSHCPNCGLTIRTRELIPIFNWLFTLGKCSKCQLKIPKSHLFLEISCTILFVLCYLKFSFSEQFILYCIAIATCLVFVVVDFKHNAIPYQILITLLILGVAIRILNDHTLFNVVFNIAFAVVFSAIFYQIFYKKTAGIFANQKHFLDYIKFILIVSIFLNMVDFALYSSVLLIIFSLIILFNAINKKRKFGYGFCLVLPFLWLILI